MRRAISIAAFAFMLAACGPPSVEEFIEDPEMLAEVAEECQIEIAQGKPRSELCRNAQEAAETMMNNVMKEALKPFNKAFEGFLK